jgi:hypothetical protein
MTALGVREPTGGQMGGWMGGLDLVGRAAHPQTGP